MEESKKLFPIPKLIIKEYRDWKITKRKVLKGSYLCNDSVVPILRDRGTTLKIESDGNLHMMGWQRDITRMRKQDVDLSFILYVVVNENEIIEKIEIDNSFNGGKGLLCSREYLQQNIEKQLKGKKIDNKLVRELRLSTFKCFHIHEIMNSLCTSYFLFKENQVGDGKEFYEEDVIDLYGEDGNLILTGIQAYSDREPVEYVMKFEDMFNHTTFDKEGYMKIKGSVPVQFYLDGELQIEDELYQGENDRIYMKFQKFIYVCKNMLQKRLVPNYKGKIMNTNMYSSAFIGAVMQAVGIRAFSDNFNYIQYIMTAMQRPMQKPGCIGSILTEEEAKLYFEGFDINKIS